MELDESFLLVLNTTLTSWTVSLDPGYAFVTIANDDCKLYLWIYGIGESLATTVRCLTLGVRLACTGVRLALETPELPALFAFRWGRSSPSAGAAYREGGAAAVQQKQWQAEC